MKAAELRELTDEELVVKLEELRGAASKLRFQKTTQQLEKPHLLRSVRRDIARIHMIVSDRRKAKNVESPA